jgi:RNA 2',3'-cyclic 3'-phosphodiesterase
VPRLFVAVWPPEHVVDLIEALPRPQVAGLRWTGRHHWHATLRFLGSVPEVEPVVEALSAAVAGVTGATQAGLGPAVDRFGRRVLQVPVSGLDGLAATVVAATAHIGRRPDDRPFTGHVTLARVGERASVDLGPLTGAPLSATWTVKEVSLVRSDLSGASPRYYEVAGFPLAGGDCEPPSPAP